MNRIKVLVLYGANATFTGTVMEHVRSFSRFSRHDVRYLSIAPYLPSALRALASFDVAVLHYSFFPGLAWQVPDDLEGALASFDGLKVLFAQDEYDNTNQLRSCIHRLGIRCLYTCVPPPSREQFYPVEEFRDVDFQGTLTGFAPPAQEGIGCSSSAERPIIIGYRGRQLHPRYGNLAREKWLIGERMRDICLARGLRVDIESSEDKRIYGRAWHDFLASSRATLGTESGSNVLDADGSLRRAIDSALADDPSISYETLHGRFIGARDGAIVTNQVSPRIFEAIAARTALILFEGGYSGVVRPWDHYLPLRKDFSNVDDVLARLADAPAIDGMTARAYADVIEGGRFGYPAFVREFDDYIASRVVARQRASISAQVIVPPSDDSPIPFMPELPRGPTNEPFQVQWVMPQPRERQLDRANAEFWNELCGTQMARELGIVDHGKESLARFDRAYLEFYPYLLERVPVREMRGKKVLEVGLGFGTLGQRIAEAGADYTGLDVAALPVRMMQERLRMAGISGRAVQGSMLSCPFDDESMDALVSIGCFHHTGDVARCVEETYRVLRPRGVAYVMVYNQFSLRQWSTWPRATLRAFLGPPHAEQSSLVTEPQRKAYDADASGRAAPETVFISKHRLRELFSRFSSVEIHAENSDPLLFRGRTIVSRSAMLRLGWLWGLDLYVAARK